MGKRKRPPVLRQADLWDNLLGLMACTHYHLSISKRLTLVQSHAKGELKKTHVRVSVPETKSWASHWMPVQRITEVARCITCRVGTQGTLLSDAIGAVRTALVACGHHPALVQCELTKAKSTARLEVLRLDGLNERLAEVIREQAAIRESEALVEQQADNRVRIQWFIPLQREA